MYVNQTNGLFCFIFYQKFQLQKSSISPSSYRCIDPKQNFFVLLYDIELEFSKYSFIWRMRVVVNRRLYNIKYVSQNGWSSSQFPIYDEALTEINRIPYKQPRIKFNVAGEIAAGYSHLKWLYSYGIS